MDYVIASWIDNPHVNFLTNLDDINQPYSCEDWGNISDYQSLIIDDDGSFGTNNFLYDMFNFTNAYPSFILIDHSMKIHYKSNGLSTWIINQNIQEMLDNCGELCDSNLSNADLNFDGDVNIMDIIILSNIILYDQGSMADLNDDGVMNILDIMIIVNIILYTDA